MRGSIKSLWSEFKSFAFKGNMIDLAVAVVIGAAFSGVINSLVKDIIMPSISYVTTAATTVTKAAREVAETTTQSVGLTSKPSTLPADTQPTTRPATEPVVVALAPPPGPPAAAAKRAEPDEEKPVDFSFKIGRLGVGKFIAELLNFAIIAFAVFLIIVKMLGSVMKRVGSTPAPSEPTTKECTECLSVIPLRAKRCANCASVQPQLP